MKKIVVFGLMTNLKKWEKIETETVIKTPFTQERFGTQHGEMLHTIDGPFQLVHADLADLNFFGLICCCSQILACLRGYVYLKSLHVQYEAKESTQK